MPSGDRLTLQIVNVGGRVEVQTANRDDVPVYWGYRVRVEKRPFGQFATDDEFDLTIATAKLGDKFIDVAGQIGKKWSTRPAHFSRVWRSISVVCMRLPRRKAQSLSQWWILL